MSKDKKQAAAQGQQEEVKETPAPQGTAEEIKSETEAEEVKTEAPKAEETKSEEPKAEDPKPDPTAEYAALNDKYLRLCAEYDNFRKRSQKEKDSLYADIKAETLKKFLPVYDNLVRALDQSTEDEAYRRGVEMIMTQFNTTMEKLGVTEIESLGQKFDPAFHNAVMHVEDAEKGENEIVEVFQKGFLMGDKVIRFAMVKVAN
ncbi:MAG: nucleotide exchange factor GrpE [Oscillospiraceae bacterium]|nr:nucleotide exchange factor GrpE [Oscillospiraceae bacterium]